MAEEIVLLKFQSDTAQLKAELTTATQQVKALGTEVEGVNKDVDVMSNSFKNTGNNIATSVVAGSKAFNDLNKHIDDSVSKLEKAGKVQKGLSDGAKSFLKDASLEKAYNNLNAKIEKGGLSQRELTKAIKEYQTIALKAGETSPIAAKAIAEAGKLKDQIDDTREAVKNMASGSRLEQFGSTLGSLTGKLASLDFEGAAQQAKQLAAISSQITFKESLGGIKQLGSALLNLGKALITNPVFLMGAAVTAIAVAVYDLISAQKSEVELLEEQIELSKKRQVIVEGMYDREINLAKELGKETDLLERKKALATYNELKRQLQMIQQKTKAQREAAVKELEFLKSTLVAAPQAQAQLEKEIKKIRDGATQEEIDATQALLDAKNQLQIENLQFYKAVASSTVKANEDSLNQIKSSNDKFMQSEEGQRLAQINTLFGTLNKLLDQSKTETVPAILDRVNRKIQETANQIQELAKQADLTKLNEKLGLSVDEDFVPKRKDTLDAINQMEEENQTARLDRQDAFIEKENENYLKRAEAELEFYEKSKENAEKDAQNKEQIQQQFNQIAIKSFTDLFSEIARLEGENSEYAKLLALFQIGLDLAKSLSATIAGASAAAAAGGPLAPVLLAGYIASGIAQVSTAFLRVNQLVNQPVPKKLAEGSEFLTGGQANTDSIPALLMPGERVVTKEKNLRYYDDLSAIHNGHYEDHLQSKYIAPAVRQAIQDYKQETNRAFAREVANGLLGGKKWNGSNIVTSLMMMNHDENLRHKELVMAVTSGKRYVSRKSR